MLAFLGFGKTTSENNTTPETSPPTQTSQSMTGEHAREIFHDTVSEVFKENDTLNERIVRLKKELLETKKQLSEEKSQNTLLTQQLEVKEKQHISISKLLDEANKERCKLRAENGELKETCAALKDDFKAELGKNADLTYRLQDLKRERAFDLSALKASLPQGEDDTPGKRNNPKPGTT